MLINDDCLNHIGQIPDKSINLILIDPPYIISKESHFKNISKISDPFLVTKYNMSIDFGEWDKVDMDWNFLFKEYYRMLKTGGTLIMFYDIWKSNVIKEAAETSKFKQPRICQWQKSNPVPINSKINYLSNAVEYFFTFIKGKNPTFNSEYDNGVYKYPICHGKERTKHPTQKPLSLIKDLIEKHSNPGDLILDTFAGSGTVGHACILTGRDFILIEKNQEYFEILEKRLKN
jgi:site-specific DNA-methyltransferase (adenine-specific)